ncbi:MAG: hypothetical protein ACTH64_18865, partial [Providencia sp.]
MKSILTALEADIGQTSLRDQWFLNKRLRGVTKIHDEKSRQAVLEVIKTEIETAKQKISMKRLNPPKIVYPENLPVSQKKQAILEAIKQHQVVIIAGETGSGKTTQI